MKKILLVSNQRPNKDGVGNKNCLDHGKNNKGQIRYRTAQYIFISKYARGKKKIIKILNEQAQLFIYFERP